MCTVARLAAAVTALCLLGNPLFAQDRMPPIPADKLTEAQKKASEAFSEGRGYAVRGPFVPLKADPKASPFEREGIPGLGWTVLPAGTSLAQPRNTRPTTPPRFSRPSVDRCTPMSTSGPPFNAAIRTMSSLGLPEGKLSAS